MVFYKLKIGNYEVRYTPISAEVKEYPYCDKEGNLLKKVIPFKPNEVKTYYIDNNGNKYETAFRLIKGVARAKLDKTKEVNNFIEVKNNEVEDLLTERQYIVDSPLLLEKLQKDKKAIKFAFSNGNGFKVYLAYIHTSNLYPDLLFMSLGQAQKSVLINKIVEQLKNKKTQDKTELIVMGVNKATTDELLEITA
jgi:hypothetical protein